jgi:hypothetical protein
LKVWGNRMEGMRDGIMMKAFKVPQFLILGIPTVCLNSL